MAHTQSKPTGAAHAKLKLRDDLRCSLHQYGGESCYVVEDPVRSKFYRLGLREWTFISFLDGHISIADALELAAESLGSRQLSAADAVRLCHWLVESELARPAAGSAVAHHPARKAAPAAGGGRVSLFYIQIPLLNPDRLLAACLPWCGWLFSFQGCLVWSSLVLAGGHQLVTRWTQFTASSADLLSPRQWPMLVIVWSLLKIVHELAHGLACKMYGGTVPCAGVALRMFSPAAYIDLTSTWRIRSKWQRIATSAAGMYVELGLAGAAALLWSATAPGALNALAHKTVLMAGLSTILFNINPLMRFDGYYILADLLGVTNLYARGQIQVRRLARRWLLGLSSDARQEPGLRGLGISAYGLASLLWRVSVAISLAVIASTLFKGLGIVLSIAAVAGWIARPLVALSRLILRRQADGQPRPSSVVLRVAVLAGVAVGALLAPWPGALTAPAVVDYAPLNVVRADCPGFVERICIAGGDWVESGQVLAVLRNDDAAMEARDLALQVEQSHVRSRICHNDGDIARLQVEDRNREALETKLREIQRRLGGLVVRAPATGRVIARQLDSLLGCYVAAGTEMMAIGSEEHKVLVASVDQASFGAFEKRPEDGAIRVAIRGRERLTAAPPRALCEPQASTVLPHPALGAQAGGPLPVTPRPAAAADEVPGYELLAPRFTARLKIPEGAATSVRAGELAAVHLAGPREAVFQHFYRAIERWLDDKLRSLPR